MNQPSLFIILLIILRVGKVLLIILLIGLAETYPILFWARFL